MSPEFIVLYNVLIAKYLCVHSKQIPSSHKILKIAPNYATLTWLQQWKTGHQQGGGVTGQCRAKYISQVTWETEQCVPTENTPRHRLLIPYHRVAASINTRGTFHSSVSHSPPPSGEVRNGGSLYFTQSSNTEDLGRNTVTWEEQRDRRRAGKIAHIVHIAENSTKQAG